ncbi:hypothetical protein ATER59S_02399 [Aquamicrobium terrae]
MATYTNAELVAQLYIGFYDRAPDPVGLNYWVGRLDAGVSVQDVGDSFAASPEAADTFPYIKFPNLFTPDQFLENVYQNVFGRAIDDDGKAYYLERIESGESLGSVVASILGNAATNEGSDDQAYLQNKVDAGLHWADLAAQTDADIYQDNGRLTAAADASAHGVIDLITADPASVDAANEASDTFFTGAGPGGEFSLTPGLDFADDAGSIRNGGLTPSDFKFTDKNDKIIANAATLTAGVAGAAGDAFFDNSTTDRDVLQFTGNSVAALGGAGITVSNIEVLDVRLSAGQVSAAGLGNFTGLQSVLLSGSIAAGQNIVFNAFANSGVSSFDVTATGGTNSSVTISDNTANQDIKVTSTTVATTVLLGEGDNSVTTGAANDAITLGNGDNSVNSGAGNDTIFVGNGDNVINAGAGNDNVTIGNGANTVDLGDGTNSLIGLHGNNTVTGGSGADTITLGNGDNVIHAGDGANVIVVGNGDNAITGGAGVDTITVGTGDNVITAGAGADIINLGAGGVNTLVFAAGDSAATAGAFDIVGGFEVAGAGQDILDFGGPAGTAANLISLAPVAAGDFAAALTAATTAFAGNFAAHYIAVDDGVNTWVFSSGDHGTTVDFAVQLTGVANAGTLAFDSIA